MAFFGLGASHMCVRVCMRVVANVAGCKKMKKNCKIVAVGVYIILLQSGENESFFSLGIDFLKNRLYLCPCNSLELQDVL